MADFEKAIKGVLRWEGGYVWHPADPGGETNMGITDMLDGEIDGMVDIDGDGDGDVTVKALTEEQARRVYKRVFWDKMSGDQIISQSVGEIIFDGFVNSNRNGIKVAQRAVGVKDDGVFGPKTLDKINSMNPESLFGIIKVMRRKYYTDLVERKPDRGVFLKGWLNRINSFNYVK